MSEDNWIGTIMLIIILGVILGIFNDCSHKHSLKLKCIDNPKNELCKKFYKVK